MRQEKKMTETIEDIIQNLPQDGSVMYYGDDEDGFVEDISGYFQHIKEELPSSSISKWEIGDKLVIKITNFIQDEDDPIENGENYYIVMERLTNNPEQQEEE